MSNNYFDRMEMQVMETVYLKNAHLCFSLCLRCDKAIDAEYVDYCSNCGQKLSWTDFDKTKIIYK